MSPAGLRRLMAAIEDGHTAAAAQQWGRVAAASIRFHEALVALAGSPRLDSIITGVLAEFRLAYAVMSDTQQFHTRFLARHTDIADAVRSGDLDRAAHLLDDYLRDAEREVLESYAALPAGRAPRSRTGQT
jgi:DNA-binding GntR family transcriptional regulator